MKKILTLSLLMLIAGGCGSGNHTSAGLRIYDPSGHMKIQVTEADVVRSSVRTGREPGSTTRTYFVYFALTSRGRQRIHSLTRALAQRGLRLHRVQHFAFEVSGHVYSRPFIDYRAFPDGIDGRSGIEIPGVPPPKAAKRIAAELRNAAR